MDPAHVPYAHHGLMRVRRRVEPGRYVTLMNFYFLVLTKFCEVIAHVVVVNQVHGTKFMLTY